MKWFQDKHDMIQDEKTFVIKEFVNFDDENDGRKLLTHFHDTLSDVSPILIGKHEADEARQLVYKLLHNGESINYDLARKIVSDYLEKGYCWPEGLLPLIDFKNKIITEIKGQLPDKSKNLVNQLERVIKIIFELKTEPASYRFSANDADDVIEQLG